MHRKELRYRSKMATSFDLLIQNNLQINQTKKKLVSQFLRKNKKGKV